MQARIHSTHRKGFNLIEAAIVLGVVGLVIGGIWIAASSVMERQKLNNTTTAMLRQVDDIRNRFKGFSFQDVITQQGHGYLDLSVLANSAGWSVVYGPALVSPFGAAVDGGISADNGWHPDYINIAFYDMKPENCVQLASALYGGESGQQLGVSYLPNCDVITTFPTIPTTAQCTPTGGCTALQFFYIR